MKQKNLINNQDKNKIVFRASNGSSTVNTAKRTNNIAIFVSHRIDLKSTIPENPLYYHTRCGAIYDKSDSKLQGDDIGDNISTKRNTFNELTVQYWAWKNFDADYYGLCHYRRYFSFSQKQFKKYRNIIMERQPLAESCNNYDLLNYESIKTMILDYDVLIPDYSPISEMVVRIKGKPDYIPQSVHDFWIHKTNQFDEKCLVSVIALVKQRQPQYYPYLEEYLSGNRFRGSCCFIMRKELFYQMCEFQFDILFELEKQYDMSSYTGDLVRQPGFMGEILYGAFMLYLEKQGCYKIKELQLVYFTDVTEKEKSDGGSDTMKLREQISEKLKKIARNICPAYRVSLRVEKKLQELLNIPPTSQVVKLDNKKQSILQSRWDAQTLTSNVNLTIACLAIEIHETHKAAFAEFRRCNTGKNVVVVATGPTMIYYDQMEDAIHIGVNKAFKNDKVKLDYYFTTDYESRNDWFADLKDYDFIKFFGQYSAGIYRDRFQVTEQLIAENNARRFFQGAPSEDIHINIEYYPLMAFYSIAFQAIHFALYTNAKRIFLVGCDCSSNGYFDGTAQFSANPPKWLQGYQKLKAFTERFYPETEIISVNPIGLKGLFYDVYTESYLTEHPEIDRTQCEILDVAQYEEALI